VNLLAQHRPRGAAEILDASAQFYRTHIGVLLVISIAVVLPPAILRAFVSPEIGNVISLAANLLVPVAQGAIICLVAAALEEGHEMTAGEAYRRLGNRAGAMIGVQIMSGFLIILGLILLVVPGFIAIAWTAVAGPVVAIEGVNGSAAISRSRTLSRGHMKHVLGTLILSWVIVFALLFGASFVVGGLAGAIGLGSRALDFIAELLFAPLLPLLSIPAALLYYDLRIRNEGADIEAMVDALPAALPASGPGSSYDQQ
jgi:tetrahydromethanopterin S-methyltransferase subunit G